MGFLTGVIFTVCTVVLRQISETLVFEKCWRTPNQKPKTNRMRGQFIKLISSPLSTKSTSIINSMSINSSSLNSPSTSQTKPITLKPQGYEFYDSNLNHPQFVVAPMVDGSELAWRILSRYYGAQLCYTPMIHSALFSEPKNLKYRQEQFDLESNEEGSLNLDRPLIAQFCSNDPQTFLKATRFITGDDQNPTHRVDAIDLNLGCPQGIAKKGKYGAFLMDHLDLINQISSSF